ncbi:hypothetical protein M5E87_07145 [Flavonifractor plautii]|nr:hypothetical protein M5E87_07145 [Flavonifractor plautii]
MVVVTTTVRPLSAACRARAYRVEVLPPPHQGHHPVAGHVQAQLLPDAHAQPPTGAR